MLDFGQNDQLAFADPVDLVARTLGEARFPEQVSVSEAARRHRRLSNPGAYTGPWGGGPYFVEHLDRPMDCLSADSDYREVAVMGPAQTGKSEIGNNWQLHTVLYDPTDMMFVMPDRTGIEQYVKTQVDKMVELTPELQARFLAGASADTMHLKRFRGSEMFFLWPGGPTFRSRPIPRGRADDVDDFPPDIAGQGDVASLLRGRMGAFSAFGRTMMFLNSSPKLGSNRGIEALVAAGTDERLWVDCLMCGEPFALYGERLVYDQLGTKEDAGASAAVVCPKCGGAHLQRDKRPLLSTWRWVGKGETAVPRASDTAGKTGEIERNRRASFRLDGLFGFRPWSEIAELGREAEIALEIEQDDAKLKAFDQTVLGRNYRPRNRGEDPVTQNLLESRAAASPYVLGEVPPGVKVLIASIDQQANRFEVAVWGFGDSFRAWLVDRFSLVSIEEAGGRPRPLRPFKRPEDWAAIHRYVMQRSYPLAGAPHLQMKLFNTAVDTGGLENATDNAFAWWHAMVSGDTASGRPPLPNTAITLFKGGNNAKGRLLPSPTIDTRRQIKGAPDAELYIPNVNRMKDILEVRLNRREDGPGFIQFARDVEPRHLAEFFAETKHGEQWVREPHRANETMDLYIIAYTVVLRFGGGDASLAWVPDWARAPKGAPVRIAAAPIEAVQIDADAVRQVPGAPDESDLAAVVRIGARKTGAKVSNRGRRRVRSVGNR